MKPTSKKGLLIFFTAIILLAGIFTIAQPAAAALLDPLVPACRESQGGCNVCDAIGVGINITKIMLGTLGSAALLMFVYGGVLMAISRGHADQVTKGKDALTNAVKGVIIVLASWVVINYGLAMMLGPDTSLSAVKLFPGSTDTQPWYQVACGGGFTITGSCNGKSVGEECETGRTCNAEGICVLKNCKEVYLDKYSCQDTTSRTGGVVGCESNLCGGLPTMMCCPK